MLWLLLGVKQIYLTGKQAEQSTKNATTKTKDLKTLQKQAAEKRKLFDILHIYS